MQPCCLIGGKTFGSSSFQLMLFEVFAALRRCLSACSSCISFDMAPLLNVFLDPLARVYAVIL